MTVLTAGRRGTSTGPSKRGREAVPVDAPGGRA